MSMDASRILRVTVDGSAVDAEAGERLVDLLNRTGTRLLSGDFRRGLGAVNRLLEALGRHMAPKERP